MLNCCLCWTVFGTRWLSNHRSWLAGHPAPAAVDPIRLDAVLARLDSLLETGDITASTLVQAEEPLLRAELGATGDVLLRQIAHFDYEMALTTLRAYRRKDARHD